MLVIGVKNVKGEYQGHAYDNYIIYFDDPSVKNICFGSCPNTEKVKANIINNFGLDNLQGADIEFVYNKFGQVVDIKEL